MTKPFADKNELYRSVAEVGMRGTAPSDEQSESILRAKRELWLELARIYSTGEPIHLEDSGTESSWDSPGRMLLKHLRLEPPRTVVEAYLMLVRELPCSKEQSARAFDLLGDTGYENVRCLLDAYVGAYEHLKQGRLPEFIDFDSSALDVGNQEDLIRNIAGVPFPDADLYLTLLLQCPVARDVNGNVVISLGPEHGDSIHHRMTDEGFGWLKNLGEPTETLWEEGRRKDYAEALRLESTPLRDKAVGRYEDWWEQVEPILKREEERLGTVGKVVSHWMLATHYFEEDRSRHYFPVEPKLLQKPAPGGGVLNEWLLVFDTEGPERLVRRWAEEDAEQEVRHTPIRASDISEAMRVVEYFDPTYLDLDIPFETRRDLEPPRCADLADAIQVLLAIGVLKPGDMEEPGIAYHKVVGFCQSIRGRSRPVYIPWVTFRAHLVGEQDSTFS